MSAIDAVPPLPSPRQPEARLEVRPPWPYGDLRPTWRSLVVCALLPVVAGIAGLLLPFGAEAVAVLAVAVFALEQAGRVPVVSVSDDVVRVGTPHDAAPRTIPIDAIVDLELVDTARVQTLLDGERSDERLDTSAHRAHPPEPEHRHPDAPVGLLVTTTPDDVPPRRARRRRGHRPPMTSRILLPVWRDQDGVPLLRAIAAATDRLDPAAVDRCWPDVPADEPTPRRPLRIALRPCVAPVIAVLATALVTVLVVLQVTRLFRAATLDAVLGTWLGTGLIFLYRGLATLTVSAVAATAFVAVLALIAWARVEQHVPPADALRLGWIRARWALWHLRVWLVGVAILLTVTGVGTTRFALAYIASSGAIPVTQAVHDLARRTVEEASSPHPPALREVTLAHQWLAAVAAGGVLIFRLL